MRKRSFNGEQQIASQSRQTGVTMKQNKFVRQIVVKELGGFANSFLDDLPNSSSFRAPVMTGGGQCSSRDGHIVRMSPPIDPTKNNCGARVSPAGMPIAQCTYLAKLDMDTVEQLQFDVIPEYADLWLGSKVLNQPIHMNGNSLKLQIGSFWFSRPS